jgi:hypothetical protein
MGLGARSVASVRRGSSWQILYGAALMLAGCSVAQSYRVTLAPGEEAAATPGCRSEAGSYSLSMTTWSFEIATYKRGGEPSPYVLEEINENSYPDPGHTYCLDYLASPLANDKIVVAYSTADDKGLTRSGLLDHVASFAVDKTAVVIRKLIRAIFIGISGRSDFPFTRFGQYDNKVPPDRTVHGRFEVDPLDAEEMAALNGRLADFGFCIVLSDYSFDPVVSGEAYCSNPSGVLARAPSQKLESARRKSWLVSHPERAGILYRPRIPYTLEIYTQDDPGHSPWKLRKITKVRLENLSPIVSLGINRAIFAQARVGLEFDRGVLENFCISKSSEVAGFIDIPLDIVYGIVELPTQTLRAQLDRLNQTDALIKAETTLIQTQQQYEEFLRSKDAFKGGKPPAKITNNPAKCTDEGNTNCDFGGQGDIPDTTDNDQVVGTSAGEFLETGKDGVCTNLKTAIDEANK